MKILMTTDTVGGIWTYAIELCRHLQSFDTEIHLATLGNFPNDDQRQQLREIPNLHLYESDFKLEWMNNPWDQVEETGRWLKTIMKKTDPDIIHLNNFVHFDSDPGIPVVTVFHSCMLNWWKAVKGVEAPWDWLRYRRHVRRALENSDSIVVPSSSMQKDIEKMYGSFPDVRVIYNGLPIPDKHASELEPIIFSSGPVWDEAKNLTALEKVAQKVKWPIYVAGNHINPSTGRATRFEDVRFLGRLSRDEMHRWMCRASMYLMPSLYEPFGLSILEAARSKCALILGNLESLNELWEGTAEFVNPVDDEEIVKKINHLIDHPELIDELAEKAQTRSVKFSSAKMTKRYFELYNQLISDDVHANNNKRRKIREIML